MATIFIFGLFPESSGKTVVSTALARGLSNMEKNVGVFKPRSGHNIWYQRDVFLKCKAEGDLFCRDILKLKEASECSLPYNVLNPVDALMSPINVKSLLNDDLMNQVYPLNSKLYSHLIIERYTSLEEGTSKNTLLLNKKSIDADIVLLDHDYITKLKDNSSEIIQIHNLQEWGSFFDTYGASSMYSCYEAINQTHAAVIVEGFNDAVVPEPRILSDSNIIIGVAPGVALFYDPEDFKRVIEATKQIGKDPRGLRAKDIVNLVRCNNFVKIPALSQSQFSDYDTLSIKMKDIVNRVMSIAKW